MTLIPDLANYSPAQLAGLIEAAQEAMRAQIAENLPDRVLEAIEAETERNATDQERLVADREARRGKVLAGFTFAKVEVPALDLSEITSLDEIASAKFRSPYNKVLNRAKRDILRPDEATYDRLAAVHEEFMDGAPAEPAAKQVEVVVADVQPEAKAKVVDARKVQALMTVRGLDEAAATALLLSL